MGRDECCPAPEESAGPASADPINISLRKPSGKQVGCFFVEVAGRHPEPGGQNDEIPRRRVDATFAASARKISRGATASAEKQKARQVLLLQGFLGLSRTRRNAGKGLLAEWTSAKYNPNYSDIEGEFNYLRRCPTKQPTIDWIARLAFILSQQSCTSTGRPPQSRTLAIPPRFRRIEGTKLDSH